MLGWYNFNIERSMGYFYQYRMREKIQEKQEKP
jgi:hypothetical protein